jgi:hypothetical protein
MNVLFRSYPGLPPHSGGSDTSPPHTHTHTYTLPTCRRGEAVVGRKGVQCFSRARRAAEHAGRG